VTDGSIESKRNIYHNSVLKYGKLHEAQWKQYTILHGTKYRSW